MPTIHSDSSLINEKKCAHKKYQNAADSLRPAQFKCSKVCISILKVGEHFFQKLVFLACLSKWCCSELFSYLLKEKLAMATGVDQVKALHEAGLFASSKLLVRSSILTCKSCYFPSRSTAHPGKTPQNLQSIMLWFIGLPLTAAYNPLTASIQGLYHSAGSRP